MKFLISLTLIGLVHSHGGHGGSHGGGQHAGGWGRYHEMFPFLSGLNQTAVQQFFAIYKDNSSTIAEEKTAVLSWAHTYNLTEQVTEYFTNKTNFMAALQANVTNVISQLSTVHAQLQKLVGNEQQTRAALRQSIEELKNTSGDAMRILKMIPRVILGHGHGHHGDRDEENEHGMEHGGKVHGGKSPVHHGGEKKPAGGAKGGHGAAHGAAGHGGHHSVPVTQVTAHPTAHTTKTKQG